MKTENEHGGLKAVDLLLVLFVGLKLAGVISWSWIWVLAPVWIPLAIIVITVLAKAIVTIVRGRKGKKVESKDTD